MFEFCEKCWLYVAQLQSGVYEGDNFCGESDHKIFIL